MLKAEQGYYVNFEIEYLAVKNNAYSKDYLYVFSKWQSLQIKRGDYLSFFEGRDMQSQPIKILDFNSNSQGMTWFALQRAPPSP